jgi:hypothetical protein
MNQGASTAAVLLLGVLGCVPAAWAEEKPQPKAAETAASGVKFAQSVSDRDNYTGDRIKYRFTTLEVKATKLGNGGETRSVCVPSGTSMHGLGKGTLVDGGTSKERSLFSLREAPTDTNGECEAAKLVKKGETVLLDPEMLRQSPPDRYGWTFGTLVVPYKYQVKGDKSVSGGATLGGYAGFRATVYGTSAMGIVFAGATKVDVPTLKDGSPVTESAAGFSYGVGVLSSIKDSFKIGLVVGADRVDKKLGYVNNGKAWLSVSLGYDFFD